MRSIFIDFFLIIIKNDSLLIIDIIIHVDSIEIEAIINDNVISAERMQLVFIMSQSNLREKNLIRLRPL